MFTFIDAILTFLALFLRTLLCLPICAEADEESLIGTFVAIDLPAYFRVFTTNGTKDNSAYSARRSAPADKLTAKYPTMAQLKLNFADAFERPSMDQFKYNFEDVYAHPSMAEFKLNFEDAYSASRPRQGAHPTPSRMPIAPAPLPHLRLALIRVDYGLTPTPPLHIMRKKTKRLALQNISNVCAAPEKRGTPRRSTDWGKAPPALTPAPAFTTSWLDEDELPRSMNDFNNLLASQLAFGSPQVLSMDEESDMHGG
ncbi:hypothetical protein PUNSTDRAFT_129010 [Punctularia strigosozonata HHB-11173 SS5]|uniref:uncharacterized protein n=1 Tax=Punctularia strigosozonata (strain HHB-11173) TaxID=741275 RepID=UPI00044173DF|nr:uncharacterized protein PUNSTDRAFT_129010 [Punctularia strigosozonata HHB-11173 SS5]EIN13323.1 hypothetical protein PUNSTDRAFT_129010 [Punctularia strigosozonata HHB-11173 SS5]